MRRSGFTRDGRRGGIGKRSRKGISGGVLALALAALVPLSGCGAVNQPPPPHVAGGVYTSTAYHFRVTYPDGWAANTGNGAQNCFHDTRCQSASPSAISQINPLTLVITLATNSQANGALVSNFTVAVLSLSDPNIAASARALPTTKSLHKTTISGLTAYADAPIQQQAPGATSVTDTHQDYYLVHGSYEYQISTDAVSTEGTRDALAGMLKSFTILR